jgi:hypothetical protein
MGREAICRCVWAGQAAECKVLLETHEMIVRGAIRRSVSIASLTEVSVRDGDLIFHAGDDEVTLSLGSTLAQSWAKKLTTPPPTLATKLGILPGSQLALIGEIEGEELKTVIAGVASTGNREVTLILASVKTRKDLNYVLDRYPTYTSNPPIWIIYPKGPKQPLGESEIRSTLRHESFIDTKVASVSQSLTALRFIKRS